MKHKLIIVDGQSTVGKSTTSKSVYKQIAKHTKAYWLHEECFEHPIRHKEFTAGDLDSQQGMEKNKKYMLEKWAAFRDSIEGQGQVCVTEGCLLHAYDRYFVYSIWDDDQIDDYYKDVIQILESLNPLVVFLHRPNLRASFEKAFKDRGDWWRDIIYNVQDHHKYVQAHGKKDREEVAFGCVQFEQDQMARIFDTLNCRTLKIDTSEEDWAGYVKQITEEAGYSYQEVEAKTDHLDHYCGTYRLQDGERLWTIGLDENNNCLFTSLFWPYMPMQYVDQNRVELISFPAELEFQELDGTLSFTVSGNYGWGYNGRIFVKIDE